MPLDGPVWDGSTPLEMLMKKERNKKEYRRFQRVLGVLEECVVRYEIVGRGGAGNRASIGVGGWNLALGTS